MPDMSVTISNDFQRSLIASIMVVYISHNIIAVSHAEFYIRIIMPYLTYSAL